MRKTGTFLVLLAAIAAFGWWAIGPDWRRLLVTMPSNGDVLFWSQDQRDAGFRMMDRVPFIINSRKVASTDALKILEEGDPLTLSMDLESYMRNNRHAAIVVLHNGKIRMEAYGLDFNAEGRWTSFSVAKSVTSTLVGAAVKDGHIASLDDPVSDYIAGLEGSAYDDVTIEQLLTMTSGVAWNEDYDDPNSDVAKFNQHIAEDGLSNLVSYMKSLPRAHPPGTQWNYSTGETNLIGILVREATGKDLADYLSEKIWGPYGMQQDASWLLNADGTEISGCCIQASTRDFARFGQFILDGGIADGQTVVPDDWLEKATGENVRIGLDGEGYGFQWWTFKDGAFSAIGIFGQGIYIDPDRQLVIATNSSWTSALGNIDGESVARNAFFKAVVEAVDAE